MAPPKEPCGDPVGFRPPWVPCQAFLCCQALLTSMIPLTGPNSIIVRAVVVHADPDDLGKGTCLRAVEVALVLLKLMICSDLLPLESFGLWMINLCSKRHNFYWTKLLPGYFFVTSMAKIYRMVYCLNKICRRERIVVDGLSTDYVNWDLHCCVKISKHDYDISFSSWSWHWLGIGTSLGASLGQLLELQCQLRMLVCLL